MTFIRCAGTELTRSKQIESVVAVKVFEVEEKKESQPAAAPDGTLRGSGLKAAGKTTNSAARLLPYCTCSRSTALQINRFMNTPIWRLKTSSPRKHLIVKS